MILLGKLSKKQMAAMDYFASALLTPQLKSHIIITVKLTKDLPVFGYTEVDGHNSKGHPREFILEIQNGLSEIDMLQTLAHEMVHVKQYCYGEIDEKGTKWLSRKMDHDSIPHHKRPWEKEAFRMEKKLYKEFIGE